MGTEAMLGFVGGMRDGMEQGLGPLTAARAAAGEMPQAFRDALDAAAARIDEPPSHVPADPDAGPEPDLTESVLPALDFLYDGWWRVASTGLGNVPESGRAVVVANHSGSLFPFDAAMIATAIHRHGEAGRWPRFLVHDWPMSLPGIGSLIGRLGGVRADPDNAIELLSGEELVITFPEGVRGTGKPYTERYRLRQFGRGFVEVALRTGAPILPVAVVGAEEIYPKLGESETLAKLTGAPYVPITPTFPALGPLGLIPLPSRWRIEFCPPVDLSEHPAEAADDAALVAEIGDRVQEGIQRKLHENLVLRGPAF